jgi:tetratricopeptide (TPR) repeat protein
MDTTTIEKLYGKAQAYVDRFEYEVATKFLIKILTTYQDAHIPSLILLGMVANELEDFSTAFDCYSRLVQLHTPLIQAFLQSLSSPPHLNNNFELLEQFAEWHLCLAQLCDAKEALEFYEKAVFYLKELIHRLSLEQHHAPLFVTVREKLVSALCAMAEIHFTDFGDNPSSDTAALSLLSQAKSLYSLDSPYSPLILESFMASLIQAYPAMEADDAKLQIEGGLNEIDYLIAQIYLNQTDRAQATAYLNTVLERLDTYLCLPIEKRLPVDNPQQITSYTPSVSFRLQIAKLAMELEKWDDAIDLLQDLNHDVAEDLPDVSYLWAWSLLLQYQQDRTKTSPDDGSETVQEAQVLLERAQKVFILSLSFLFYHNLLLH